MNEWNYFLNNNHNKEEVEAFEKFPFELIWNLIIFIVDEIPRGEIG